MTAIVPLLTKVMADVGAVKKLDHNSQGNFNFRGIDAVTSAVYPALVKHGVIVAPEVVDYQYGSVVVGRNRTEMGHARLTVKFTWYGPDGDSITTIAAGEAFDSGDKATAKAHSVAFRTTLLQTLCLPTDEPDPDSHTYERAPQQQRTDVDDALDELADTCVVLNLNQSEVAGKFYAAHKKPARQATAKEIREFINTLHDEVKE